MTCEIEPSVASNDVSENRDVSGFWCHVYVNKVLYIFEFRSDKFVYFT
jgi:hypothetical protein